MTRDDDGYVALFRRVYSNPAFRDWDEASVFIAIFAHARWRDGTVSTPHGPVALKRGECLISERDLAAHFLMHLNKVRRVLRSLVDHGMVALDPGSNGSRLGTRITVLNYEQYQGRGRRGGDAAERCGSGAGAQRERNEGIAPRNQRRRPPESREEREERESNQKASPSGPPELPSDLRTWVWRGGLAIVSAITGLREKSARSLLGRLLAAAGEDHERLWCVLLDGQSKHPLMDAKAWLMAAAKGGGAIARERERPPGKYDATWAADLASPSLGGRGIGGWGGGPGKDLGDPDYDIDGTAEPVE